MKSGNDLFQISKVCRYSGDIGTAVTHIVSGWRRSKTVCNIASTRVITAFNLLQAHSTFVGTRTLSGALPTLLFDCKLQGAFRSKEASQLLVAGPEVCG